MHWKKLPPAAAVFFGDFDAHQAQLEELADDVFAEDAGFVHLADVGADLLARELAHGGLKELLFFRQRGERLGRNLGLLRAGWHGFISLYYTGAIRAIGGPCDSRHARRCVDDSRCRC